MSCENSLDAVSALQPGRPDCCTCNGAWPVLHTSLKCFSRIVSDRWLDDEVIGCLGDAFHAEMAGGTEPTRTSPKTLIAATHLRTYLADTRSGLSRYSLDKLASRTVTRLLIPCRRRRSALEIQNQDCQRITYLHPLKTFVRG